MKALVISQHAPPVPGRDVYGVYKRFGLFMGALGRVAEEIETLHFVPRALLEEHRDLDALSRVQSAHLGANLRVGLAEVHRRQENSWNHYATGISAIHRQPVFHHYGSDDQVRAVAAALARRPDLVFVHRLAAMVPLLRAGGTPARILFDLDDVEHRVVLRKALAPPRSASRLAYLAHVPAILAAERRAAAAAEATFVCSATDRDYLLRRGLRGRIEVIPNAVAMPDAPQPLTAAPTLLFLGTYTYGPNRTAADRLVRGIWPRVHSAMPDATLLIAGGGSESLPGAASPPPGVTFTGFVPDLAALYARARVIACPLTVGGGTRVKLIEAAGYAKPMVSTRIGAEGLDFAPDREILLRDGDEAFAEACLRLFRDDALCQHLGTAARAKAETLYRLDRVQDRIAAIMAGKEA
ncbi:glycosyltransferase [Roseomonas sp. CCTCC AB2023176]|uniref:glycosyltransferase n=1 Tax=Roseomonas sp. CCTCC AB2023176 TaxID=3342640 RepID=UPI0035D8B8CB